MDRGLLLRLRGAILSALGITILLGTPLLAQADQGKWWKPKEGDQRIERRDRNRRDDGWQGWQGNRGWQGRDRVRTGGGWSGGFTYRDGRYNARGSWGGYRSWRGYPVRRDILVIRDRSYGGYFRARRIYCAPRYYGRFVYVRPVRFFVGADACIGPIGIHARIVRPHYIYGCNFCDARFDSYGAYCQHVEHCDHRPTGFDISVSNWDDGYGPNWDGPYQTDDSYYDNGGTCDDQYDNNTDDDEYYDE